MKRFSVFFAVILLLVLSFPALAQEPMVGEIRIWPSSTLPDGWILCNGAQLNSTDYPELYAVLGTTYGSVPGFPEWFLVPNLRERVPVGRHSGVAEFDTLGETGGAISHTLTIGQIPAHSHNFQYRNVSGTLGAPYYPGIVNGYNATSSFSVDANAPAGGGQPHPNLQPYQVFNYILYTGVLSATPTPTATSTPTETPTPTATPTGSVTPSATSTSTLYLPYVITTTLQSGTVLGVPEQVSFGQIITSGVILSLIAVVALDFLFRFVYRR